MSTRHREWYVPKWGPYKLRSFIGMTFWPYSLMNMSYAVIGSMLAPVIYYDRVIGIAIIYLLALGISGHALDAAFSSEIKPWGNFLSKYQLIRIAMIALIPVVILSNYYIWQTPLLLVFAILETFFLFAYNMEFFDGKFHTDKLFAFSWATLPLMAGYVIQTNTLSWLVVASSIAAWLTAYIEINASRPYKSIMRSLNKDKYGIVYLHYEYILKSIVLLVILVAAIMVVTRL